MGGGSSENQNQIGGSEVQTNVVPGVLSRGNGSMDDRVIAFSQGGVAIT